MTRIRPNAVTDDIVDGGLLYGDQTARMGMNISNSLLLKEKRIPYFVKTDTEII